MVAVSAPFGLRPVFHPSGTIRATAFYGGITSAYNTNIFEGQPVLLNTDGTLNPVASTTADYLGSFAGVEFTDVQGRRRVSNFWPANTVGTDIVAYAFTDPDITYEIEGTNYAATAVGDQAIFANLGNGSTVTGQSAASAGALQGAGNQGQVRILGRSLRVDNNWGDVAVIVQVQVARHQYVANKTAI
jgi:hypothetical protein